MMHVEFVRLAAPQVLNSLLSLAASHPFASHAAPHALPDLRPQSRSLLAAPFAELTAPFLSLLQLSAYSTKVVPQEARGALLGRFVWRRCTRSLAANFEDQLRSLDPTPQQVGAPTRSRGRKGHCYARCACPIDGLKPRRVLLYDKLHSVMLELTLKCYLSFLCSTQQCMTYRRTFSR